MSNTDIKKTLEKVVINIGVGKARQQANFDDKILPEIEKEIATITGQKASRRPSRKSEAGFKVRAGNIVGLKTTLRGQRMQDFMDRLNNIVFPRVKDFRGIDTKHVDGGGNLNIGLVDQFVFPEIDPNTSKVNFGMQITIVPAIKNREKIIDTYKSIGVPLK